MQIESASLSNKEEFIQIINAYNIELTQHKHSLRMFEEKLKQDASYNKLFKGQKTNNLIANEKNYFFNVDAALCSDSNVGAKFTLCERWIAWKCD